jgi:hyperosmotically inducible periplasmic protein
MKQLARNSFATLFCVFVFAMGVGLSAGSSSAAAPPDKNQSSGAAGNSEAVLADQVRHQLVMLPWYSVFDNLQYTVQGNEVILSGEVVRPVLKDDAASAVKRIKGVQEVDDHIEVLPLSSFDNQIRFAELREIYSFPSLQRYGLGTIPSIHIIVKNGNVTLEGAVDNQTDKDLAGLRANGVPNVFSVTNNLRVLKNS